MNDFFADVMRLLLRLVLVAIGFVFFLSLLAAAFVLALVWGLRMLWARMTGQPVTPWVMGVDPRAAWRATATRTGWGRRAAEEPVEHEPPTPPQTGAAGPLMRPLPGTEDVTDVTPRAPRE